jgi:hypothetical protein
MRREDAKKADIIFEDFRQLSNFSIDLNSSEFSSLVKQIFNNCLQAFEFGYGIPEDQLRDSMKNAFFQIQDFLEK